MIGCAGAGPQKARGSLLLKVFRGVDLVVAPGRARAGTPSLQPVWRPALQSSDYEITRVRFRA